MLFLHKDADPGARPRGARIIAAAGVLWVAAVAGGGVLLQRYASTPGVASAPPGRWPEASAIARTPGKAVVVMLAHPGCPCPRASIGELAELIAQVSGKATAHVLFLRPDGVEEDWEKTDRWRSAAAIPGVTVSSDVGGVEAARFHASTSGETIVYGADGRLLFRGGITASRGHAGDNPGLRRIASLLTRGSADRASSPVFGCPLNEPEVAGR